MMCVREKEIVGDNLMACDSTFIGVYDVLKGINEIFGEFVFRSDFIKYN